QEEIAFGFGEALDERLCAQRRLDRRSGGEARRLQRVEDEMVEVAFANALEIRLMHPLDVRRKAGGREAAGFESRVKWSSVVPRDADRGGRRVRRRALRGGDATGEARRHDVRANGQEARALLVKRRV